MNIDRRTFTEIKQTLFDAYAYIQAYIDVEIKYNSDRNLGEFPEKATACKRMYEVMKGIENDILACNPPPEERGENMSADTDSV